MYLFETPSKSEDRHPRKYAFDIHETMQIEGTHTYDFQNAHFIRIPVSHGARHPPGMASSPKRFCVETQPGTQWEIQLQLSQESSCVCQFVWRFMGLPNGFMSCMRYYGVIIRIELVMTPYCCEYSSWEWPTERGIWEHLPPSFDCFETSWFQVCQAWLPQLTNSLRGRLKMIRFSCRWFWF